MLILQHKKVKVTFITRWIHLIKVSYSVPDSLIALSCIMTVDYDMLKFSFAKRFLWNVLISFHSVSEVDIHLLSVCISPACDTTNAKSMSFCKRRGSDKLELLLDKQLGNLHQESSSHKHAALTFQKSLSKKRNEEMHVLMCVGVW